MQKKIIFFACMISMLFSHVYTMDDGRPDRSGQNRPPTWSTRFFQITDSVNSTINKGLERVIKVGITGKTVLLLAVGYLGYKAVPQVVEDIEQMPQVMKGLITKMKSKTVKK